MNMRGLLITAVLLSLFCGAAGAAVVTDDLGVTVEIPEYPQRIISLSPANTEILFALGLDERIVGVTEYCTYPDAARTKETVGGFTTINVEKIASLNPDLIVAAHGNSRETVVHLRELGFTIITVNADTIGLTINDIAILGKATGTETQAKALISSLQEYLDEVAALTANREKPTILHCLWTDPLWVSGSRTFQDEMITAAGGINAAAAEDEWVALTMEKFLMMNPDIIVVDSGNGMGVGADDALLHYFLEDPRMQTLSAVKNGRVYVVDADLIDRGGPRIKEGVEALAQIAHPDIFGEYGGHSQAAASPGFGAGLVLAGLGALLLLRRR